MKIELLKQREPFEDVFAQTINRGLSAVLGTSTEVLWQPIGRLTQPRSWICNDKLNAVYRIDASRTVRQAVRQHYGRHPNRRRQWLARGYIALATRPSLERRFASARLRIEPAHPDSQMWLFRGGGRQIRWFDFGPRRRVWAFAKPGHDLATQRNEYQLRQRLPAKIPQPTMSAVDDQASGYWEDLIDGIPLDQVVDARRRRQAFDEVVRACNRLIGIGARAVTGGEYAAYLQQSISACLSRQQSTRTCGYLEVTESLEELIANRGDHLVALGLSHGDVQGDNVISLDGQITLTDWEFIGERQAGYAFIDGAVGGHNIHGMGARLARWVATAASQTELAQAWARVGVPDVIGINQRSDRFASASIYLLEKFVTVTKTASSRHLHRVGEELSVMITECNEYLRRMGAPT